MKDKFLIMIETELQAAYDRLFNTVGRFEDSFVAGGCVTSLVLGEPVNDYDIWFESVEAWQKAVDRVKALSDPDFNLMGPIKMIAETEHALTFEIKGHAPVYQLVKSRCGGHDEVIEQFDFLHAQVAFFPRTLDGLPCELFWGNRNCVEFIREKVLVFAGQLDYPVHTLSRIGKFAKRGWRIPDRTIAQLVMQIREASEELITRDLAAVGKKYDGGDGAGLKYLGKEVNYDKNLDRIDASHDADLDL